VSAGRLVVVALVLALASGPAAANPWAVPGGAAPAAPAEPPASRPSRAQPADAAAPGFATPWPLSALVTRIAAAQRTLNQALARDLREIRETGSPAALATVGLIAFVYGVLHAAGPGHGKLVVSAYFVSGASRPLAGFLIGGLVSGLQVLSALVLVSVLAFGLGERGFAVMGRAGTLEVVSYGLVVAIGLTMLVRALLGRHAHAHASHVPGGARVGGGLVLAAGLTPCASAIILLLFALGNGVFAVGVAASGLMALGMTITVSLVGVATIVGRQRLLGLVGHRPRAFHHASRALAVTGSAVIAAVGALFLAGAWTRL
jgi:nickel/cobalt transporter (NicO) family protein